MLQVENVFVPLLSPTSSTVQSPQGSVQQRDCQVIPADDDLTALFFLGEHETQGSGDHALLGRWKPLEQIARPASATRCELKSAPFPNGALHLVADRISESFTLACGQIVVEQAGKNTTVVSLYAHGVKDLVVSVAGSCIKGRKLPDRS